MSDNFEPYVVESLTSFFYAKCIYFDNEKSEITLKEISFNNLLLKIGTSSF